MFLGSQLPREGRQFDDLSRDKVDIGLMVLGDDVFGHNPMYLH